MNVLPQKKKRKNSKHRNETKTIEKEEFSQDNRQKIEKRTMK